MDFSYETSDRPQFLFQTTVFLNVPFLKWYILKQMSSFTMWLQKGRANGQKSTKSLQGDF